MRFYTNQHKFYCGIDLHTNWMYVCILDGEGDINLHRNVRTRPKTFLRLIEPFREDIVVCAECMFTWYWLADLCNDEDIPFVLGCITRLGKAQKMPIVPSIRIEKLSNEIVQG